jgi:hypothetical protein
MIERDESVGNTSTPRRLPGDLQHPDVICHTRMRPPQELATGHISGPLASQASWPRWSLA